MKDRRVIIDTHVVFAGLYSAAGASHQVLRLIDRGVIKPVISAPLLFEYEDVLRRHHELLHLIDDQIDIILDNLCALSDFQSIHFLWRPYLRDPKDDHILEVAVAAQVKRIVTHNVKDFAGSERFGIKAIPPRVLLEMLK